MMFFNILAFHLYISGVYFGFLMIILIETKVKGFLWKYAKKKSFFFWSNHRAGQLPISERYWILLTNGKTLRCNLSSVNGLHILVVYVYEWAVPNIHSALPPLWHVQCKRACEKLLIHPTQVCIPINGHL